MGTDMVAAGGTPVYASVDGVVRISQDSYGGYGVTVVVESVLNGQQVSTVYPHMQTGSRQVAAGQTVTAGQLVGIYMDMTGLQMTKARLDSVKRLTVQQAQELLQHQVQMAQTMARFLGDSTARGEELVERLMSIYDE